MNNATEHTMKRTIVVRSVVVAAVLALLAGLGVEGARRDLFPFDGRPASEGEVSGGDAGGGESGGPPEDKVAKGKLAAADLGDGWSDVPTASNRLPQQSSAPSFSNFCGVAYTPPVPETRSLKGAFRKKETKGGAGASQGQSRLLAQRLMEFANDDVSTGAAKADLVLEDLRSKAATCTTWETQDPNGATRTWTVTPLPAPGMGNNSLHFRVTTTVGTDPNDPTKVVEVANDVIVVRRGRVLNLLMQSGPAAEPPADAKANAGKADGKLNGAMSS